ncbi:phospholipase A2 inhibitor and Ly6/PLAUR domain-containing protein-like [Bufo bufo]|uniref:phospholipase A2 inhibitor and Ly6/PLAUR domain-containing protein-like n=1 Tax=Bufo bufo TaxID=8384 RepID=UPI001ABDD4CD|nr:phospholipase A2 inhibitor and Ly6/PLAUR domain-containing protein-like [Bufo bufo]
MTSILGILTVFSALVATACALSCTECVTNEPSTTTCSGNKVSCANGFLCGSTFIETVQGKGKVSTFGRRCVHKSQCDFKGNVALSDIKQRTATTCCSTEDCTPPVPTLIPSNENSNGLTCPYCDASGSITCDAEISLKCTGSEDRCLHRISEHNSGQSVYVSSSQMCATESYCDHGIESYTEGGTTYKNVFFCTNGGTSVQKVVLTPAVVCLLLMKWLF